MAPSIKKGLSPRQINIHKWSMRRDLVDKRRAHLTPKQMEEQAKILRLPKLTAQQVLKLEDSERAYKIIGPLLSYAELLGYEVNFTPVGKTAQVLKAKQWKASIESRIMRLKNKQNYLRENKDIVGSRVTLRSFTSHHKNQSMALDPNDPDDQAFANKIRLMMIAHLEVQIGKLEDLKQTRDQQQ